MNAKTIPQFRILLLLLSSLVFARLPGDLNNDGLLNVADLVRIRAMIDGNIVATPEADLNFDEVLDELDYTLLKKALMGNPLPRFLCSAKIGAAGGSIEHVSSGFKLTVPPGAFSSTNDLVLAAVDQQLLSNRGYSCDEDVQPLMIFGLPAAEGLEFSFQIPPARRGEGQFSLQVGTFQLAKNAVEEDWYFQRLNSEEEGISHDNGTLYWRPQIVAQEPATRSQEEEQK